jgi:general nucleoside transport system ATP-binding protein
MLSALIQKLSGVPVAHCDAVALALSGVRKSFGSFLALDDAYITARRGELHALVGENGAGKSTLMNIAAGFYAADSGSIEKNGIRLTLAGPADARANHIGMVHQHFKLVRRFTVAENILLANPEGKFQTSRREISPKIRSRAESLGFKIDPERVVQHLSIAEQQRVEIIKVLMAGAEILILDEPTSVLTDLESARLLTVLRDLAMEGVAVILVTHKLAEALDHTDRITVMRNGRTIVASVAPKTISPTELTRLIVGADVQEPRRTTANSGLIVLRVTGLKCADDAERVTLEDATFSVAGGEIYGVAGVSGNGQRELAEALMNLRAPLSGRIAIDRGNKPNQPDLAFIPADRYSLGLAGGLSIVDNFAIRQVQAGRYGAGILNRGGMRRDTETAIARHHIHGVRSLEQKAALLSGGNAQKLVLARELASTPAVILAQSPSRGLDVRACAAVHEQLLAARASGIAVLLISDDLDEILALSDRVGVMTRGRIVAEFSQPADRQQIGKAMLHHV